MGPKTKRGLGKGFESLLSQDFDRQLVLDDGEKIQQLAVDVVKPNREQPRRRFDSIELNELAESIKAHGILLPLVVTRKGNDYLIVAGERRWRAAKLAGLDAVPAVVRSLEALEALEISLIENVQRVDLSPLEQAASLRRLHDQFSIAYDEIAKRLGKAPSTVHNTVRLLHLPSSAQSALFEGKISEGHARAILALKHDPEKQTQLLNSIIEHGWSVREAERFVLGVKAGFKNMNEAKARVQTETEETKLLTERLKTPVHIKRTAKGGRLEISFKDDSELTAIIERIL